MTVFDQMNQEELLPREDMNKTVPLIPGDDPPKVTWEEAHGSDLWFAAPVQPVKPVCPMLVGTGGVLEGVGYFFMAEETRIGVDPAQCQIVLPLGTPGVSRRHLRFWLYEGCPSAMDLGSTYGSTLNGQPMKPGLVYALNTGDLLKLGSHEEFRVE